MQQQRPAPPSGVPSSMEPLPQGYTWDGIIDFLSYHQGILKAREDAFSQERLKFKMRIHQLEQENWSLKMTNEQMSKRIRDFERIDVSSTNPSSSSSSSTAARSTVQKASGNSTAAGKVHGHHNRVKSDQMAQNLVGRSNEDVIAHNASLMYQNIRGNQLNTQHVHGASQSISFHSTTTTSTATKQQQQQQPSSITITNTNNGAISNNNNSNNVTDTGKSLMHQFLQNVGYAEEDAQQMLTSSMKVPSSPQQQPNFLKFDDMIRQQQQQQIQQQQLQQSQPQQSQQQQQPLQFSQLLVGGHDSVVVMGGNGMNTEATLSQSQVPVVAGAVNEILENEVEFDQMHASLYAINARAKRQKKSIGQQITTTSCSQKTNTNPNNNNNNNNTNNTIIYNQTTVNAINSNNFISTFTGQQMQINHALSQQNNFIREVVAPNNFNNPSAAATAATTSTTVPSATSTTQQAQSTSGQSSGMPITVNTAQNNSSIPLVIQTNNTNVSTNASQNNNLLTSQKMKHNNHPIVSVSVPQQSQQQPQQQQQQQQSQQSGEKTKQQLSKLKRGTSSTNNEAISDYQMVTGKKIWNPKCTLRSHLDGVRGLFFTAVDPILVTASEDCLLKLWDTRLFKDQNDSSNLQPYYTLRGHSSQIFAVTGSQQHAESKINYSCYNFVFSAGVDGVIRAWNLPLPDEVVPLGPSERKGVNVGEWQGHHEAIWDINHHPFSPIMLSAAADGFIRLWKTFASVDGTTLISLEQGELLKQLSFRPGQFSDTPTSVTWDHGRNHIVSGWVATNSLVSFEIETGKVANLIHYTTHESNHLVAQVNKVVFHEGMKCAISGHEDKQIRFFDMNSNVMIKNLIGHTDAVTCLSVHPNQNYISSVGHDGSMRTWDIRKYQCIHDISVHKRKYDESVHTVMYHQQMPLIATGGADGLVKIFHKYQ